VQAQIIGARTLSRWGPHVAVTIRAASRHIRVPANDLWV
jgi:hypothetical protein